MKDSMLVLSNRMLEIDTVSGTVISSLPTLTCTKDVIDPMTGEVLYQVGDIKAWQLVAEVIYHINRHIHRSGGTLVDIKDHFCRNVTVGDLIILKVTIDTELSYTLAGSHLVVRELDPDNHGVIAETVDHHFSYLLEYDEYF